VLGAVTAVAFVALCRARAALLGAAYLAGNALLLVPTRDPEVVAALAGAGIAALAALEWCIARRDVGLRTLEGGFVRAMVWVPPGIVLVRSALHYDLSALYGAVATAAIALALTAAAGIARLPEIVRAGLRGGALAALGLASGFVTWALEGTLPGSALLPLGGVVFAASATGLSLAAGGEAWGVAYRRASAWVLLGAMGLDLVWHPGVVAAVACLVTSVAALSYGFLTRRRVIVLAGAAGAALSLIVHLRAAIDLYAFSHWGSLALVGIAVILAATFVERKGAALAAGFHAWRERFADWE
jgi:hypothetical protein